MDENKEGRKRNRMAPDGSLGFKFLVFFVFLSLALALSALATCLVRKRREVPVSRNCGQVREERLRCEK